LTVSEVPGTVCNIVGVDNNSTRMYLVLGLSVLLIGIEQPIQATPPCRSSHSSPILKALGLRMNEFSTAMYILASIGMRYFILMVESNCLLGSWLLTIIIESDE
jgi:hypothetical protein